MTKTTSPTVHVRMRLTAEIWKLAEQLAAHLTLKTGTKHNLRDAVTLALKELAEREKLKA